MDFIRRYPQVQVFLSSLGTGTGMGTNIYPLPGGNGDETKLTFVGFGYGDENEFFFLRCVWDSKTRPRPLVIPSFNLQIESICLSLQPKPTNLDLCSGWLISNFGSDQFVLAINLDRFVTTFHSGRLVSSFDQDRS